MNGKFLLINGSPRRKGTSVSFSRTIKSLLEDKGCQAEIVHVIDYFDNKRDIGELKTLIEGSSTIGLITPLYVDFLTYPDIWLMEILREGSLGSLEGKNFFAVCQFGFPHVELGEPLLESCRIFAKSVSMKWLGGLSYGGGAIIDGRNLEDIGKSGRKIISGLKIACDKLLLEEEIPAEAQEAITVRIPRVLYRPMTLLLNHMSKSKARKVRVDIYARPYLD